MHCNETSNLKTNYGKFSNDKFILQQWKCSQWSNTVQTVAVNYRSWNYINYNCNSFDILFLAEKRFSIYIIIEAEILFRKFVDQKVKF